MFIKYLKFDDIDVDYLVDSIIILMRRYEFTSE